mmetsp:Transcript_29371/g.34947  ORF Transcript_29371/g.34947 Transcript_29371/m.34947 type:complete len:339 (+) Transcript_29371:129-1145(+)|eukprot:CAMPEP_0198271830 /NCGR_PEP_ID=MMETSP1447-20131203/50678_1 /TAXON_ID=420782 /ORGANISM="Chaetoceros dichaeta, Strain CCMP1751" /LENGTH=338 /DNA_ID=CAMNT_0043964643 /DNA_START=85 /DNA_END=1101 /DNA_ORIENTATION=+
MITSISSVVTSLVLLTTLHSSSAFSTPSHHGCFVTPSTQRLTARSSKQKNVFHSKSVNPDNRRNDRVKLEMGKDLDLVTSLRTEYVSAALCTNQIPAVSKSVLQIGTDDGRAVYFVPNTVEELITSSAEEGGIVSMSCRRQLKQQKERRGTGLSLTYFDQAADDLKEVENDSVDAVISLQAADRMKDNGMDWKKSLKEVARVLKPGGRFLFVEKTDIDGSNYVEEVLGVTSVQRTEKKKKSKKKSVEGDEIQEEEVKPTFELVGFDKVDYVLVPHVAGVVEKAMYSGMTASDIEAQKAVDSKARMAELSISAFERGLKRRRKKKKKKRSEDDDEEIET